MIIWTFMSRGWSPFDYVSAISLVVKYRSYMSSNVSSFWQEATDCVRWIQSGRFTDCTQPLDRSKWSSPYDCCSSSPKLGIPSILSGHPRHQRYAYWPNTYIPTPGMSCTGIWEPQKDISSPSGRSMDHIRTYSINRTAYSWQKKTF